MIGPYGAYACADGDVMFAIQTDREWRRFCSVVMQSPTLADDSRYATNASRVANRVGLEAMIEARFRSYAQADVIALPEEADIATGAVNDVPAVAAPPPLHRASVGRRSSRPAATYRRCYLRTIFRALRHEWDAFPHSASTPATFSPRWSFHDVGTPGQIRAKYVVRARVALGHDRQGCCQRHRLGLHRSRGFGSGRSEGSESRNVIRAFAELDFGRRTRMFRMNGVDTPFAYRDLVDVVEAVGDRIDLVMLPKAGSAADVQFVATLLTQIESKGVCATHWNRSQIESAAGFTWLRKSPVHLHDPRR
jgi:hypothetical protein